MPIRLRLTLPDVATILGGGSAETLDGFKLLLSGDEQAGTDALLLSGDEQAGTDVLLLEGLA